MSIVIKIFDLVYKRDEESSQSPIYLMTEASWRCDKIGVTHHTECCSCLCMKMNPFLIEMSSIDSFIIQSTPVIKSWALIWLIGWCQETRFNINQFCLHSSDTTTGCKKSQSFVSVSKLSIEQFYGKKQNYLRGISQREAQTRGIFNKSLH